MPQHSFIIIADDDQFFGALLSGELKEVGYDVAVVTDGKGVMDQTQKRLPALIVLDLIMPIKDGFEVIRELQADEQLKKINILVLTNLAQEEDKKRAAEMGAKDFLVKANVSIVNVVEKIKSMLHDNI